MNDKFYLETILTSAKNLCDILFYATTESSNPDIHQTFQNCLNHALTWQNAIYKQMEQKGYYQVQDVNQAEIVKEQNKIPPLDYSRDCNCGYPRA